MARKPARDQPITLPAPVGMRYLGARQPDQWVPGVPARNLSAAEWGALDPRLKQQCLASGLYEYVVNRATDAPAEPAPEED